VTDFLDFGSWPVFNLADASIVAGVVVLVLLMMLEGRATAEEAEPESPVERPRRVLERPVIVETQSTADSWDDKADMVRNE
jgi:hypothetical protein